MEGRVREGVKGREKEGWKGDMHKGRRKGEVVDS